MTAGKRDKLLQLIVEKAFKYSDKPIFKLASGKVSSYYVNCKMVTLDPYGLSLIGEVINDTVKNDFRGVGVTAVGGLTLGADPIAVAASLVSYKSDRPLKAFVIRKEAKKHGLKKWIEGDVASGDKVIIIEDVITTGMSTIKAIERALGAGLEVKGVISLVDREEGGVENIKQRYDFSIISVFKKSEMLNYNRSSF